MMKDKSICESDLIGEALNGGEHAYAELVRLHQEMVSRVIFRLVRRPDLVEDLVQETFIKAFENLSKFKRKSGFSTWLYRIAVNTGIQELKSEKSRNEKIKNYEREQECLPDSIIVSGRMNGERQVLDREKQMMVKAALANLSADSRSVLVLRYLEDMSTPEIAKTLSIPEGTVRSRLFYARKELAETLRPFKEKGVSVNREKEE